MNNEPNKGNKKKSPCDYLNVHIYAVINTGQIRITKYISLS